MKPVNWDRVIPIDPPETHDICQCGHDFTHHEQEHGKCHAKIIIPRKGRKPQIFTCDCYNFDWHREHNQ